MGEPVARIPELPVGLVVQVSQSFLISEKTCTTAVSLIALTEYGVVLIEEVVNG
jgi:hypothetical protein